MANMCQDEEYISFAAELNCTYLQKGKRCYGSAIHLKKMYNILQQYNAKNIPVHMFAVSITLYMV
jgi:hypothetical protein